MDVMSFSFQQNHYTMVFGESDENDLLRSHLEVEASKIRGMRTHWKPYLNSRMISQLDYDFIVEYESAKNRDDRNVVLNTFRDKAVYAFIHLVTQISSEKYIRYSLTMIDDMLAEDASRIELFAKTAEAQKRTIFSWFLNYLHSPDVFSVNITSSIITRLATYGSYRLTGDELDYYMSFLKEQMNKGTSNDYISSTCRSMQTLFRQDGYRYSFAHQNGLESLVQALYSTRKFGCQIQYQIIFCIWLLTFNRYAVEHSINSNIIQMVSNIVGWSQKEKLVRITLAAMRNILEKIDDPSLKRQASLQMVQCKLLKKLHLIIDRKFDDPDILEDIEFLKTRLEKSVKDFTSFDEYEHEVRSGALHWSPVHKCDTFWSMNAHRLNEKNNELLKLLLNILETSQDPLVLCVAAHDVGEYVRYYPLGKRLVDKLGGKESMMRLLTAKDPNVRYHALLSAQKLMIHNWENLELACTPT